MIQYHGTSKANANIITDGKIDITKGGGELGQGFYTGNLLYKAFARAYTYNKNNKAVVELIFNDDDFLKYDILYLSFIKTYKFYKKIACEGKKHLPFFKKDILFASVVGDRSILPHWCWGDLRFGKITGCYNQLKFESKNSENFLNSNLIIKKIHL